MIQWILHAFWIEVAGVLYNRRIREEKLDVVRTFRFPFSGIFKLFDANSSIRSNFLEIFPNLSFRSRARTNAHGR